jgi:hypothetical protein
MGKRPVAWFGEKVFKSIYERLKLLRYLYKVEHIIPSDSVM